MRFLNPSGLFIEGKVLFLAISNSDREATKMLAAGSFLFSVYINVLPETPPISITTRAVNVTFLDYNPNFLQSGTDKANRWAVDRSIPNKENKWVSIDLR